MADIDSPDNPSTDVEDIDVDAVVDQHYKDLGDRYNELLYYSPAFVRALTEKMVEKLKLEESDRLVDLGCGTGMYSIDMLQQVELKQPVIGVDPFETMLRHIPEDARIEPVCEDALSFSEQPGTYDKVLIKETVHHIDDRETLFSNLHDRLSDEGVLLLVHVPPNLDYPLFDAALERCLEWHADPNELTDQLKDAGFSVERDSLRYQHELPKQHYHEMVRNRYMSVLHSFDEDELNAGLKEMEERDADRDVLTFIDHFDYIAALKV